MLTVLKNTYRAQELSQNPRGASKPHIKIPKINLPLTSNSNVSGSTLTLGFHLDQLIVLYLPVHPQITISCKDFVEKGQLIAIVPWVLGFFY